MKIFVDTNVYKPVMTFIWRMKMAGRTMKTAFNIYAHKDATLIIL